MHRAAALVRLNGRILGEFSRRTVTALNAALPLRIALPYLEPLLALNLEKEIQTDALVIRHACAAVATGIPPDRETARELFAATQAVDASFLLRVENLPIRIVVPYADIEPLRIRRIHSLAEAAYRIRCAWQAPVPLRAALRASYSREDLDWLMSDVFDLYAREVRALSRCLQLPALLAPLRERVAQHLDAVMRDVGARLARELARGAYRN
jgi:hypothetical protein